MKLSLRNRQLIKFVHVLLSSFWIGTVACILLLITLDSYITNSIVQVYILSIAMKQIVTYITIPSIIGSYITGNIMTISTNWEKYLWVKIKRPLTGITFFTACLYLRVIISRIASMAKVNNAVPLSETTFSLNKRIVVILCLIQLIVALFMFIISYLKPWTKKVKV